MSKSTNRYGNISLRLSTAVSANPTPTKKIVRRLERLDAAAKKTFNKPYDSLSEKEKSELHFKLAVMRDQRRDRQAATRDGV